MTSPVTTHPAGHGSASGHSSEEHSSDQHCSDQHTLDQQTLDQLRREQHADPSSALCHPLDAIAAIARGELIVVVDDEDRENEGDLVMAADHVTPEAVNFMITHGKGLVCTSITRERAAELQLPSMTARNEDHMGTAFTVSVDGTPAHGVTTGISASDRSTTIKLLADGAAGDLQRPGHAFPLIARDGGVLARNGHTEASVDFARLAGCSPVGVIVEIIGEDGEMLHLPQLVAFAEHHGLKITSIALLQGYLADATAVAS